MRKTFYIAGSSENRQLISELGDDLEASGWYWYWNWTQVKEKALNVERGSSPLVLQAIHLARPGLVMHDLHAAANCDVFVLHLDPGSPSFGGAVELGTRLQTGKPALVVLNDSPHHLFYEHPGIVVFKDWDDLLSNLDLP